MPKCIVTKCPHKTGQKELYPSVILHPFPGNIEKIKQWLLQTGEDYGDYEVFAEKVLEAKKTDAYRICSRHFAEDQYVKRGPRKLLSKDAVPTIFSNLHPLIQLHSITGPPPRKRRRGDDKEWVQSTSSIVRIVSRARTIGTQTDPGFLKRTSEMNTVPLSLMCSSYTQSELPFEVTHMQCQNSEESDRAEFWRIEKDHLYPTSFSTTSKPIQWQTGEYSEPAKLWRVKEDHLYSIGLSKPAKPCILTIQTQKSTSGHMPDTPSIQEKEVAEVALDTSFSTSEDPNDPTLGPLEYMCANTSQDAIGSTLKSNDCNQPNKPNYIADRKFIIFESCLDKLLRLIPCQHNESEKCEAPIAEIQKHIDGSMVKIQLLCHNNHKSLNWNSQPMTSDIAAGNILMSSSIILSGSSFQKVKEMYDLFGVQAISHTTFCQHQNKYIFPAIDWNWKKEQQEMFKEIGEDAVVLAGDRQFDSPRNSANYCIYSLMTIPTQKIVNFRILQLEAGQKPVEVEKAAFQDCLDELLSKKVTVKLVATDRHVPIRQLMATKYKNIKHQFDAWHLCKCVAKKITAASRHPKCKDLTWWITPIQNHLWWCVQTSRQNPDVLIDKWQSVLFHIADVHSFPRLNHYKRCMHRTFTPQKRKEVKWIKPNHPAHRALEKIVSDPALLRDLRHITKIGHTPQFEVYRSKSLKYRSKSYSYKMDSAYARTILAILSNNHSVGRERPMPLKSDLPVREKSYQTVLPMQEKNWRTPIYRQGVENHLFKLQNDCLSIMSGDILS
ncbi:ankyrin repeat domain 49 S homeolog isoform X1 [Xenopus laevis]|uniref:Ankyrin repeat domain 49 S homeolog isoform X1 n=1 Tax=Xenopus laevis TaxID=8355 RepID=A0A8J0UGB7_XENLA|nr:ankyrin repeat domain 49 S homeolog isoform X1 [Xenopus laevis]XP_018103460.1 ankyrin repeat domain 49 S homeolog isoform X1 [Xenopus laevis]XP_018103461.1 ankyrin repeat domain 49 S homeolog isoform X1 [Xenopus laevis]